ncbi:hypothetical protein Bbelb_139620 [Branchiostoma belcheri]|nr:hypothetical protein Bbelb_139620 [Branchiostoma belcheri]
MLQGPAILLRGLIGCSLEWSETVLGNSIWGYCTTDDWQGFSQSELQYLGGQGEEQVCNVCPDDFTPHYYTHGSTIHSLMNHGLSFQWLGPQFTRQMHAHYSAITHPAANQGLINELLPGSRWEKRANWAERTADASAHEQAPRG